MGWQPRVAILKVPYVPDMEIRQFWTEKWTGVLSSSFLIAQIPHMKKSETKGVKK
jgi:hypothetical protein